MNSRDLRLLQIRRARFIEESRVRRSNLMPDTTQEMAFRSFVWSGSVSCFVWPIQQLAQFLVLARGFVRIEGCFGLCGVLRDSLADARDVDSNYGGRNGWTGALIGGLPNDALGSDTRHADRRLGGP